MKSAAVALIVTASTGILILLGVGLFFALIPKPSSSNVHYEELTSPPSVTEQTVKDPKSILNENVQRSGFDFNFGTLPTAATVPMTVGAGPFKPLEVEPDELESDDATVLITPKSEVMQIEPNGDAMRPIGFVAKDNDNSKNNVLVNPSSSRTTLRLLDTLRATSNNYSRLADVGQVDLKRLGKMTGLGLRNHVLAVASYSYGTVALFEADSMHLLAEIPCSNCNLFDLDIMPNGDIVAVDSRREKLLKFRTNGERVTERYVRGAKKGVTVCADSTIYVLTELNNSIKVLDEYMVFKGSLSLNNVTNHQCKYIHCERQSLLISCDKALLVINLENDGTFLISAGDKVTYGVGVSGDPSGQIHAARRGLSVIDVYEADGKFAGTYAANDHRLWSDIAVQDDRLYAIDYIASTINYFTYK